MGKAKKIMSLASLNNDENSPDQQPWWLGLPVEFKSVKVSKGIRPSGFQFSKAIINMQAELPDGTPVSSCGEADTEVLATTKAIAELIERSVLICWHKKNRSLVPANSNGWAAHETTSQAKLNAAFELSERDAVLSHWYSAKPFLEVLQETLPAKFINWVTDELSKSEYPNLRILISTEGIGPSVTCLFLNNDGFGVSGHATKANLQDSIDAAIAETCRAAHHAIRKSFWDDTLILKNKNSGRVQPGAHSVYYAYHEPFPNWMFGENILFHQANELWSNRIQDFLHHEIPQFEFHNVFADSLVVGFVKHSECFDLNWRTTNLDHVLKSSAAKKLSKKLTKESFNHQPHIVS